MRPQVFLEVEVNQTVSIDSQRYKTMEGHLVFEKAAGGSDPISAENFADLLKSADIPLLVLNACQSGKVAEGIGPEATVATRLLQQGTAAVVAMGYSVYAAAAAEFMAVFYDTLFRGATVSEAVVKGRAQLHRNNLRPSPKGLMPLEDWIVPVHYVRREISFPHLKQTVKQGSDSLTETLSRMRGEAIRPSEAEKEVPTETLLMPEGAFFGRDAEFYELERALYRGGVVLVHGVGGTGKTELVKAFARWLAVSGGLSDPRLVLFQSFEPGRPSFSLEGILTDFGLNVFGPEFIRLFPTFDTRRKAVFELLCKHRILVIWDNFETVCSMPDSSGATPPLEGEKRTQVKAFLADVAKYACGGILVTSRSSEDWLGRDIYRLNLSGLT